ncbi:MAG TPA: aromatic amino acid ammonia-lyase [Solirubrobacteraceae bacterium]|nr:aromatic amino acid ammonia-lyase [Solirubrobacteraceae bacterium]
MLTVPAIVLDGATLTPAAVAAVARDGQPVELAPAARARNEAAREAIASMLERGQALYGATTGVGALRDRTIGDSDRERFQWNLLRSHAVSAGRPLSAEQVRAGMVVRANQIGAGGAGVNPALLDGLAEALNAGVTPLTREFGSLGTGDLPGLAEIALALLGEGKVWRDGELVAAPTPRQPVTLGLRDALGFMSSDAMTAGYAALLSVDARALHERWLEVAALSFEALHADPVVLDPRVQAARGARGQTAVAERMRELLAGAPFDPHAPDRLVQDPYPFRVLPQVDGVAHDALGVLEQVLGRELNARPENALIDGGRAFPTGNFHAAELGAALDALRAAFAHSASLIAGRVSAILDPRMSGLEPFLAADPGPDSGHMMLEYTAHAAAAEARSLAAPMASQSVWASLGVESHASLAATGATRTAELLHAMDVLVATELVVTVRALQAGARAPAGAGVRALFDAAAQALPAGPEDRRFGLDVEAARELLASRPPR